MSGALGTRAGRLGLSLVAAMMAAWYLLTPAPAAAQEPQRAADDLREHDVTFEEGALSGIELDDLDSAASRLQGDGYYKVVVLGRDVTDFDNARDYAEQVHSRLGGDGRVQVYTPSEVAIASNVDSATEVAAAEEAAARQINQGGSLAGATVAAAAQVGVGSSTAHTEFPWGAFLLLLLLFLVVVGIMWWAARKASRRSTELAAARVGEAESKVRAMVDKAANDVIDLADRIDNPDTPTEARTAYAAGAELFTEVQEPLETADTRGELEKVYPDVVRAGWHLDVARALLDGQTPPEEPQPEPLFPAAAVPQATAGAGTGGAASVPASGTAARAEPHYQRSSGSPWITAAATAALSLLAQRGLNVPRTRPSMDDRAFSSWTGGKRRGMGRR